MSSPLVTRMRRAARRDPRLALLTDAEKDALATPGGVGIASQAEAEAGTDNSKMMTALRVAQAIAALAEGGMTGAEIVTAINTALGGNTWQQGGGSMTGAAIVAAIDSTLGSTTWQNGGGGGSTPIVNDLTTGGTTSALSAQQGVVLKGQVDGKQANLGFANLAAFQTAVDARAQAIVDALVGAAPGALNTLVELATALGNDANFATTMTNALAAKAPLASPTFTGTPAGPTATAGTSTTQLATTAFVTAALAAKADIATTTESVTGTTYTLVQADNGKQKVFTNVGAIAVTVPAGLTNFGVVLTRGNGAGNITITGSGATVRSSTGTGPHSLQTANSSVTLLPSPTANEYTISGPLGAASGGAMTGSEIVAAIDTQLGSNTWQGGGGGAGGSGLPFGWAVGFFNDLELIASSGMNGLTQTNLSGGTMNGASPTSLLIGRLGVGRVDGSSGQTNSGVIIRSNLMRVRNQDEFVASAHFDPTLVPAGTTSANVGGRFGWAANITAANATIGIGFEKIGHDIKAYVRNGATVHDSTGTYTVSAAGSLHFHAQVVDTTHVRFRIYADGNATPVFDETITTAANVDGILDTEPLYPMIAAWTGSTAVTGAVTAIANLDYIGWGNPTKYPGRPF